MSFPTLPDSMSVTCLNLTKYHCESKQGKPADPASHTESAGAVCREGGSADNPGEKYME